MGNKNFRNPGFGMHSKIITSIHIPVVNALIKELFILFLFLFPCALFSQNRNLVPNPGFEICSKYPFTWMANKAAFHRYMQFWTSPNQGSPDVLVNEKLPYLQPPRPNVSMEGYKARTGQVMAGLKTYGCKSNVSHCKEYLQIKVTEPLVPGEEYIAGCWVSMMANAIKSNHLGIAFSTAPIEAASVAWLQGIRPVAYFENIMATGINEWVKLEGQFATDSAYQYLLIGNFFPDSLTQADTIGADLRYSYYMIDDVFLRSVHKYSRFEGELPETNVPIALQNVYFKLDKAELLPSSHKQLNTLAAWLVENPFAAIELRGHTDSSAGELYNYILGKNRAEAVATYLFGKGISKERISVKSFGESQPAAINDTAGGRRLNRRVEFVIPE